MENNIDTNLSKPSKAPRMQSVEKALILLETLALENKELSLNDFTVALGWPKSTIHGFLSILKKYNYVEQSSTTGRYSLGVHLFELGSIVSKRWDIRNVARPILKELNENLGEMVQLAVEDNGEVLYIEKIDSSHAMRIVSEVGVRLPMHGSGMGKVLLAHKPPAEVRWIISQKGLSSITSHTITNIAELEKELEQIKKQGYAIDDREIMDSLFCVAAPIYSKNNNVRYAISVSGLYANMQGEKLNKTIKEVTSAANKISQALDYGQ